MELVKHPRWGEIKAEILNPARTIGWLELAEKYDVRDSKGNLAVIPLVQYWSRISANHSDLMATAKESLKDFLRSKIVEMQAESYAKAMEAYSAAMDRMEMGYDHRGNKRPVNSPNFVAAKMMLDSAQAAASNLASMVKTEPAPAPNNTTLINPVFGNQRTQILALPKLPQVQLQGQVLEAKKAV